MSTYYKNGNLQTIYRIAASRVTYERADGTIGEMNLDGGGGGMADWNALANKPEVVASGATEAAARDSIGAAPISVSDLSAHNGVLDATTALVATPVGSDTLQRLTTGQLLVAFQGIMGLEWANTANLPVISNLDTIAVSRIGRVDATTVGVANSLMIGATVFNFFDEASNTGAQLVVGGTGSYVWTRAWAGSFFRAWRQAFFVGPEILAIEDATSPEDCVLKFNELLGILQG